MIRNGLGRSWLCAGAAVFVVGAMAVAAQAADARV
jgi:hypothetical protein